MIGSVKFLFLLIDSEAANNIDTSRGTTRYEVKHKHRAREEGGGREETEEKLMKVNQERTEKINVCEDEDGQMRRGGEEEGGGEVSV